MSASEKCGCILDDLLTELAHVTREPHKYISSDSSTYQKAFQLQKFAKRLYDNAKSQESSTARTALPKLVIDKFDDEQIWQQLELQNNTQIKTLVKAISRSVTKCSKLLSLRSYSNPFLLSSFSASQLPHEETRDGVVPVNEHQQQEEPDLDLSDEKAETLSARSGIESGSDSEIDFDFNAVNSAYEPSDEDGTSSDNDIKTDDKFRLKKRSVVDDQFFKLADMESFLEEEDKKEERRHKNKQSEPDDENDVDYFNDITSSEDEDGIHAREVKYEDFFDAPMSMDGEVETEEQINDDAEAVDSDDTSTANAKSAEMEKSSFEKRQDRIRQTIAAMEEEKLSDKPWQLTGEVSAAKRPDNSLLEEHLLFDHTVNPPPLITEETTKTLEDIIKQRIKDQAWDDVERKEKPKSDPYEYKKNIILDQEKSKLSLGEIYEQEYIKQTQLQRETEEEEKPEHAEIKNMMATLFQKLDALSNFHYTPKEAVPEVKIVSNLPSITVEEVAPVTASNATLLAPQEVKEKSRKEMKGSTEKSDTDRKRERRERKAAKRARRLEKEKRQKLIDKVNPGLGNKYAKEKALKALEKQERTTIIKEPDKKRKKVAQVSSKQFFSQLQQEVSTQIKKKKAGPGKKSAKQISGIKLKL